MPEDRGTPEQYEETVHPDNPPRASAAPAAAVAGMWYLLGPVAVLILALAVASWVVFSDDGDTADQANTLTGVEGTVGESTGVVERDAIDSTQDELDYRGAGDDVLGRTAALAIGSRVDLDSAEVVGVGNGADFWIDHRGQRVGVLAPQGAPNVRDGMRVRVSGTVEGAEQGEVRIRATQVAAR